MNALKILFASMFLALILAVVPVVKADLGDTVELVKFKINGMDFDPVANEFNASDNEVFKRGEDLDIQVKIKTLVDLEDAQVSIEVVGDRYNTKRKDSLYDFSKTFQMDAGKSQTFDLKVTIPDDLKMDDFKLRLRVDDKNSFGFDKDFQFSVEGMDSSKAIKIDDFSFSPQDVVVGRAFTALVRVENVGEDTLDDLKVTVSVPALNIEDSEYLDANQEVDPDHFQKFEELLLRVPTDAKPGTYDVKVLVEFDKYEEVTATGTIKVVDEKAAGPAKEDKTLISIPSSQELVAGSSVVYPILLENTGLSAKTYSITVSGLSDWATYKIDPAAVVVVNGESSSTVLLTVMAKEDAAAGAKSFVISVQTPQDTKQVPVTANIVSGSSGSTSMGKVQEGLTIGLVVLVIILIILGLIIGFTKLRGSDKKDEEEQTYY